MKKTSLFRISCAKWSAFWCLTFLLMNFSVFCQTIFQDNFESGTFGPKWTPQPSVPKGLVTVATTLGTTYVPHEGLYGAAIGLTADISGGTAINALDLHLDLAGKTNVELSFWFKDVSNTTYAENGIFFSNNGGQSFSSSYFPLKSGSYPEEWGQFPPIDISKVSGLSMTSNFVIRFQQKGNKDFNSAGGDGGFLFDDVVVRVSPVQYATLPFNDDFEEPDLKNNWSWVNPFYCGATVTDPDQIRPDGVVAPLKSFGVTQFDPCSGVQVLAMGQRQDPSSSTQYVSNALDLHLDLSGQPQVEMRFCIQDLDAYYNSTGIGIFFSSNSGQTFKKVYDLVFNQWTDDAWGELPPIDIDRLAAANGLSLTSKFVIRFQARFNHDFNPSNGRQGVLIDNVRVRAPAIQYAPIPFFDSFESGSLSNNWHWSDAFINGLTITDQSWIRPDGLTEVLSTYAGVNFQAHTGSKVLALGMRQDPGSNSYYAVNAVDLHLNLQGASGMRFNLWMRDYNDSNNAEDAIYFSDDGGNIFKKAFIFTPGNTTDVWNKYSLNVDSLCNVLGLTKSSTFIIRIQQRGNHDFSSPGGSAGFIIDDVEVCFYPSVLASSVNTTCGLSNGTASVTATGGGTTSYTYQWSNGQTTSSIGELPAGTYTVTVTAVGGCSSTASVTVSNSFSAPSVSSFVTHTTCGQANGKINLTVIGLNSPYTYDWGVGQPTTEDRENLSAGTYTVTVTDSKGCTTVHSKTVNTSQGATVNLGSDLILQPGNIATLCANNPPFASYLWSTGATTGCISVSTSGNYSVTVTASNGCTATDEIKVNIVSGINDLSRKYQVLVFPNPIDDFLTILCEQASIESISIVDQYGRVILQNESNIPADTLKTLDTFNLSPGMYFLYLRVDGHLQSLPVVKK